MAQFFTIEKIRISSPSGEKEFHEVFQRDMPKRVDAYQIKLMFAATYDSYYDELHHFAIFETEEQAQHLMDKIDAAKGKIDLKYWITGGCVAASSLKGGATETVYYPQIKF